jgi:hypothetical protein
MAAAGVSDTLRRRFIASFRADEEKEASVPRAASHLSAWHNSARVMARIRLSHSPSMTFEPGILDVSFVDPMTGLQILRLAIGFSVPCVALDHNIP